MVFFEPWGTKESCWYKDRRIQRETAPRCCRLDLATLSQPASPPHTQQLHPITPRLGSPFAPQQNNTGRPSYPVPGFVRQFLLPPCLYSAPDFSALVPVSCCQAHTCALDRFGHLTIWHLVLDMVCTRSLAPVPFTTPPAKVWSVGVLCSAGASTRLSPAQPEQSSVWPTA